MGLFDGIPLGPEVNGGAPRNGCCAEQNESSPVADGIIAPPPAEANRLADLANELLKHAIPGQTEINFERGKDPKERPIGAEIILSDDEKILGSIKNLILDKALVSEKIHYNLEPDSSDGVRLTDIKGLKVKLSCEDGMKLPLPPLALRELDLHDDANGLRIMSAKLELPIFAKLIEHKDFYRYSFVLGPGNNTIEQRLRKSLTSPHVEAPPNQTPPDAEIVDPQS